MATNIPIEIDELFGNLEVAKDDEKWFVIHTRPRCEKKLAKFAFENKTNYYLPQIDSFRQYKHRKVKFTKPMFSGYMFTKCSFQVKRELLLTGYVANFIKVINDKVLTKELQEIYLGKERGASYQQTEFIKKGIKVKIISGPLKEMTGYVENESNIEIIILSVSMLRQAVSVTVSANQLKIIRK